MSRFQENFIEIRKNTTAKRVEKMFRKFFHAFFKYQKYQKYCVGFIDTIESAKVSILLLLLDRTKIATKWHISQLAFVATLP